MTVLEPSWSRGPPGPAAVTVARHASPGPRARRAVRPRLPAGGRGGGKVRGPACSSGWPPCCSGSPSRLPGGGRPSPRSAPRRSRWAPRPRSSRDSSSKREACGSSCRTAPGRPPGAGRRCRARGRRRAGRAAHVLRRHGVGRRSTAESSGASDAPGWRSAASGRSRAFSTGTGWRSGRRCGRSGGSRACARAWRHSAPASPRAFSSGATRGGRPRAAVGGRPARVGAGRLQPLDAGGDGARPRAGHGPGRPIGGRRDDRGGLPGLGDVPRAGPLGRAGGASRGAGRRRAALLPREPVDAGRGDGHRDRPLRAVRGRGRAGREGGAHGLGRARWAGPWSSTPTRPTCWARPRSCCSPHRPAAAADVGFQLSFGATLGILALAGPLTRGVPRLPLRLDLAVAASVAAQCALAPILAGWFHRLAPAAVLLNIAAVPLSGAVLLAGLAVLVVAPLGPGPAQVAGDVAWIAARALRLSGDLGPLGPWLDVRVAAPTLLAVALQRGRTRPALPRPKALRPRPPARVPPGSRRGAALEAGGREAPPDGDRRGPGRQPPPALALRAQPAGRRGWLEGSPLRPRGDARGPGAVASGRAPSRRARRDARPPRPRRRRALPAARVPRGAAVGGAGAAARSRLASRGRRAGRRRERPRDGGRGHAPRLGWGADLGARAAAAPPAAPARAERGLGRARRGVRRGPPPAHGGRRGRGGGVAARAALVRPEGAAPREPVEQRERVWSRARAPGWPSSRPGRTTPSGTLTPRSSSATGAPAPSSCGRTGTAR